MVDFDYVASTGAAGRVLASRLCEDPGNQVLLLDPVIQRRQVVRQPLDDFPPSRSGALVSSLTSAAPRGR
jgi:hypothetical protein